MPEHSAAEPSSRDRAEHAARGGKSSVLLGLLGLAVALVAGLGALALWGGGFAGVDQKRSLRPFGDVPDFSLLERNGQPVTKADLLGKVWIAGFIFTRCVEECPLLSSRMAKLQDALATEDDVRLVSISVDPEHDTPAVLTRYAAGFGAHPQRWLFLTGDKTHIYKLAREGFRLGVFDAQTAPQTSMRQWRHIRQALWYTLQFLGPTEARAHHGAHSPGGARQAIQHSARLVLVDRRGRIRQYYDSNDEHALTRLQRDVYSLLRER